MNATSEVVVPIDPASAFTAFTDEMNSWWARSHFSFYDSARAIARTCEPGVGGRLLEVYDNDTGDALELGRITVWEPGSRLTWLSSVDDVEVDVTFAPEGAGTRVRVDARLLPGGDSSKTGSFSFARVLKDWFGGWCATRDDASREPKELGRVHLALYYAKPATAARWLNETFQLDDIDHRHEFEDDDGTNWIEFAVGDSTLILLKLEGDLPEQMPVTHMPWIYVDDLDAHFANAKAKGATIVTEIEQYGYRRYVAADLEGRHWTFAQARPTMRT